MAKWRSPFRHLKSAWKGFFGSLLSGSRLPMFIPSVLGEPEDFLVDPDQLRTRRMEAAVLSIAAHASIILLALLLVQKSNVPLSTMGRAVMINAPFFDLPNDSEGGGGGGGGGKREQAPQAWGGMPNAARLQLLPPEPAEPQPLVPADALAVDASVVMPIEIPRDQSLPIGDLTAPFNNSSSSGPGGGDGIGDGDGTGVGPGKGPGYGPGKNGGFGGGEEGTIGRGGNGVYPAAGFKYPEILFDPKPAYTEEARKSRTEGIVVIQALVRKDGAVDSFRVLRGLGHGLDESAIQTIGTRWRFKPGRLNGVPVDVQVVIEVSFRLF